MELLAPAGKKESLYAAVNNGCDAVYLGGIDFGARSAAGNFSNDELKDAIDYCHLRGVKVFITVNTLYKNGELSKVLDFVSQMHRHGADAFILQDIGTATFLRKTFTDIKLHASTQMTAHSVDDVLFLREAGFDRVVLSRECSLDQIRHITKECFDTEIEVFVHGALCVCYSGQCLMSSVIGGRSGNRGRCAQPCRLSYELSDKKEGHLLSPKDMAAIDILPDIINAGVHSVKIEGRMKSPEYAAIVTNAYRRHIDKALDSITYEVDKDMYSDMLAVFNRGGSFSNGYFNTSPGEDMMSLRTPKSTGIFAGTVLAYDNRTRLCRIQTSRDLCPGDGIEIWTSKQPHCGTNIEKNSKAGHTVTVVVSGEIKKGDLVYKSYDKTVMDKASGLSVKNTKKLSVKGSIYAKIGEPMAVTLRHNETSITATGDIVEAPKNSGMSPDDVIHRLSKTGDTTFSISFESNQIDDSIYASISSINQLRRYACNMFKDKLLLDSRRETPAYLLELAAPSSWVKEKTLTVLVRSEEQLMGALDGGARIIYMDFYPDHKLDEYVSKCHARNAKIYIALSRICHNNEVITENGADGYLIRTYGQLYRLKENPKKKILDYSFNLMNNLSLNEMLGYSHMAALSTELSLSEINQMPSASAEIVVYGRLPLMTTRQCPIRLHKCGETGHTLKDRTGALFPVITDCRLCYASIFNSRPIFLLHKFKDVMSWNPSFLRMELTVEDYDCTQALVKAHLDCMAGKKYNGPLPDEGFTNGHLYRGVL